MLGLKKRLAFLKDEPHPTFQWVLHYHTLRRSLSQAMISLHLHVYAFYLCMRFTLLIGI